VAVIQGLVVLVRFELFFFVLFLICDLSFFFNRLVIWGWSLGLVGAFLFDFIVFLFFW
jgi:hypothetical protein